MNHRLGFISGCCAALAICSAAKADGGVPAILQFAEQYQNQCSQESFNSNEINSRHCTIGKDIVSRDSKKTGYVSMAKSQKEQKLSVEIDNLRHRLKERKLILARQNTELNLLQKKISLLQAQGTHLSVVDETKPEILNSTLLKKWVADMAKIWRMSPDEKHLLALLKQSRTEASLAREAKSLADHQLEKLRSDMKTAQANLRQQQQLSNKAQDDFHSILQSREKVIAEQQTALRTTQTELDNLRKQSRWKLNKDRLKDEKLRMSYAAGSALGHDIQDMIEERKNWGIAIEQSSLVAGIIDTISGNPLLSSEELRKLIEQADALAAKARKKQVIEQQLRDKKFIAEFRKRNDVQESRMGFWYRIDYVGNGEIAKNEIIDVVVKEMLSDGTVIQDMDLSQKVLSQPLSKYPPLFREAIGHLQNHGSLTMVVPPTLAYGEAGYPPRIPPNATMVYELRIANVQEIKDTAPRE
ncbi:FKBP-type peptidyl-prolyl cis-trans isomerase N-terminal domain-containing protein [Enterobacter chuandaensis]